MLQQSDVARHQRGSGKTEHLPKGKIPGHHRQHGADGLVTHETARGIRGDGFIRQVTLPVFRVIAAGPGALLRFGDRGLQRLAHLEGHYAAVFLLRIFENVAGVVQPLGARGEGSLAVGLKSGEGVR
jgi:hypothetical protein